MELFLQFGYGMMEHCRSLICDWGRGTVILSPRDLKPNQLETFSNAIREQGGTVLLDPQFYSPYSDHARLVSHDYWPKEYESDSFQSGGDQFQMLEKLKALNDRLGCTDFILPGRLAEASIEDWLDFQQLMLQDAEALEVSPERIYATVALGADIVRNVNQIHDILDASSNWNTRGIYLICEHPTGAYLVDDPIWLTNVLDLTAGFRLKGWRVLIGYCNHQMLAAASAAATGIASGTWMNVRSFPPDKFRNQYEEEIRKRTTWYYCPQALSEYKIPFLDIAQQQRVLEQIQTPAEYGSTNTDILFRGPQPSTVQFSEQAAFRHYLYCLRYQTINAKRPSFDDTLEHHRQTLATAERLLRDLRNRGITGQPRDFSDMIDVNRAALSVLDTNRGAILRRRWASL
jgi:hypothetical protein